MESCKLDLGFLLSVIAILSCALILMNLPSPQRQLDEIKLSIQRLENEIVRLNIAIADDDDESLAASDESTDESSDSVLAVQ